MVAILWKKLLANLCCFLLLFVYILLGGLMFLHFERDNSLRERDKLVLRKLNCIDALLLQQPKSNISTQRAEQQRHSASSKPESALALRIAQECLLGIVDPAEDRRKQSWNFRNALLYGFGILTTLGYGKIEPETIQARLFTVIWGFFGVPFTVIILTNLGLYMRRMERYIRQHHCQRRQRERARERVRRCFRWIFGIGKSLEMEDEDDETISINPWFYEDEEAQDEQESKQISPFTMAAIVITYLTIGAIALPFLKGGFDFIDGLFYSYLCFTAIEYGYLIPENNSFIPIVIVYILIGLAMSTIALDIGSNYVKKLYYLGKKATNIAHASFFYGSKSVTVKDLLSAVGQAIGISPDAIEKVDLDRMVTDAIAVKEGHLDKVPQNYMFLEGIWPPELIPLFQRDGQFPEWADADEFRHSIRTASSLYNNNVDSHPALSLSTFADGCLHRSLHSTSSNSSSWRQQHRMSSTTGAIITTATEKDRNNNNNNKNNQL